MVSETVSASITIEAPAETIFAVLVDPATHPRSTARAGSARPLDRQPLSASGQVFRMAMYHADHPNGNYEMANRVQVFDPPHALSWLPGYDPGDSNLRFGGWIWRYDLAPVGPFETEVRLSYDWSAVPAGVRHTGPRFPPFAPDHLDNSLNHLAALVVPGAPGP